MLKIQHVVPHIVACISKNKNIKQNDCDYMNDNPRE